MKVQRHQYPLAAHRVISIITITLLFAAFLLLLLVGISLPIVKSIYIFAFIAEVVGQPATSIATQLRFGVWGVCATSALNVPTITTNLGVCFGPQLGYEIPSFVTQVTSIPPAVIAAVQRGLLVILVLHPIAAILAFLGFFFSFFFAWQGLVIVNLVITIFTAIVASIVLAVDVALVAIAKQKLKELDQFLFSVGWGPAVWMVVVATALTWVAVIILSARACYCCGVRKYRFEEEEENDLTNVTSEKKPADVTRPEDQSASEA